MHTTEAPKDRHLPGWRAWVTATVVAPLAMLATCAWFASQPGAETTGSVLATALVFALIYAAAVKVTRLDLWALAGSYVLAAALSVAWGVGLFVAFFTIACNSGCMS